MLSVALPQVHRKKNRLKRPGTPTELVGTTLRDARDKNKELLLSKGKPKKLGRKVGLHSTTLDRGALGEIKGHTREGRFLRAYEQLCSTTLVATRQ
jgi:hypothetical protein